MTFKNFVKINPFRFVAFLLVTILIPILSVLGTYLVQQETNSVVARNWQQFVLINIVSIIVLAASYCLYSVATYLTKVQQQELNDKVRRQIVEHYYFDKKEHHVSDAQNRLTNDLTIINDNYFLNIYFIIYGAVQIIAILVYLIALNWTLLIANVVMVLLSLALPKLIEAPLSRATNLISESNQKYIDTLNEWLAGLDQIRQFMAGAKLFSVSQKASKKLEDATVKQTAYTKLLNGINGTVSAIFGLLIFILTGYLVKNGVVTIGVLLIVGNFRFYLNQGLEMITVSRGEMKGTIAVREKVNKDAEFVPHDFNHDGKVPAAIATENLSLQFPNGEKLTYPDLTINQGEKILLTGDSGAGKSTLFKLVLGQIKPSSGKIIFKDQNGEQITPDMSHIGYIPQDPVVFPASISDNITMFDEKLDPQVKKVVSEIKLSTDVDKFKDGLNHELDLDKLNISGGQRQKIVLARAKIHDSDIILIDEGTSAIDQNATMKILDNLVKTPATIVFIAHNFNEKMRDLFDREIHLVK